MSDADLRITENVALVRQRIADAAVRSGRTDDQITLVAVTKYVGLPEIESILQAGCNVLGESRPQQLRSKADALQDRAIQWHLIGHLQRNKVARTLPLVSLMHSLDSLRLLKAVDREMTASEKSINALLEVNVSGDTAKHGFEPDKLEPLLESLARYSGIGVRGLMTMAGRTTGSEGARRDFARLRELRDSLRRQCPENVSLNELSMGMSGDYEIAIEEGATIVRVGSALFEGVTPAAPDQND
jgi:pyridoxal phosphate enzyme (YggS family)